MKKWETGYDMKDYVKIHTGNIIAWAHLKWVILREERNEVRDRRVDVPVTGHVATGGPILLSSGVRKTRNDFFDDLHDDGKQNCQTIRANMEKKGKIENKMEVHMWKTSNNLTNKSVMYATYDH